jgi:hypothetical protein
MSSPAFATAAAEAAVRRALAVHRDDDATRAVLAECLTLCASDNGDAEPVVALVSPITDGLVCVAALRALGCALRRRASLPGGVGQLTRGLGALLAAAGAADPVVTATALQTAEALVAACPHDAGPALLQLVDGLLADDDSAGDSSAGGAAADPFSAAAAAGDGADHATPSPPAWCRCESLLLALRCVCTASGAPGAAAADGSRLTTTDWRTTSLLRRAVRHAAARAGSDVPYIRAAALLLLAAVVGSFPLPALTAPLGDGPVTASCALDAAVAALTLACPSAAHHQAHLGALALARALVDAAAPALPPYLPRLLPWLCFSRYLGPERHRFVALETWKRLVTGPAAAAAVAAGVLTADCTVNGQTAAGSSSSNSSIVASSSLQRPASPPRVSAASGAAAGGRSSGGASVAAFMSGPPAAAPGGGGGSGGGAASARTARSASPMRRYSVSAYLSTANGDDVSDLGGGFTDVRPEAVYPPTGAAAPGRQPLGSTAAAAAVAVPRPAAAPGGNVVPGPLLSGTSSLGPRLLAAHMPAVVELYASQLASPAPVCAEGACHCVGELAAKVDATAVRPHAARLLGGVVAILTATPPALPPGGADAAPWWAMRDAAVVASAKLALAFFVDAAGSCSSNGSGGSGEPADTGAAFTGPAAQLPALWLRLNASDGHRMVRDHAAMVLGLAMAAQQSHPSAAGASPAAGAATTAASPSSPPLRSPFGGRSPDGATATSPLFPALRGGTGSRGGAPSSPAGGGGDDKQRPPLVAAVVADLRARLAAAGREGLWDASPVNQQSQQPDERAMSSELATAAAAATSASSSLDGAIYLLRELGAVDPPAAGALLPALADAASQRGCPLGVLETLARPLPDVGRAVGKQALKRALDSFLQPLCELAAAPPTDPDTRGAALVAGDALAQLRAQVGPPIFDGRLSPEQAALLARAHAGRQPLM